MGRREVIVKQSAAESIASISWYIESMDLVDTAEKFSDSVYNFFLKLANPIRVYSLCKDPQRAIVGYKCVSYKKKYTVVFIENENEVIVCEFVLSKTIHW